MSVGKVKPEPPQFEPTLVEDCARCGKDHEVYFLKLERPMNLYTHWAMCPNNEEPILMLIEQT